MKYRKFLELVEKTTGVKPTHALISQKLGGKPTAGALSNRYFNDGNLSLQELFVLKSQFPNIEIETDSPLSNEILDSLNQNNIETIKIEKTEDFAPEQISEELKGKYAKINYWDGCSTNQEKIINPLYTELIVDLQRVINVWNCNPADLCIIAMPGEEMNGGCYPIKNNDLLIIDKSQTDISSAGIYFYTTNNHSCVFVRRVMEKMKGHYMFTCDNQNYSVLNSTYSMQELEEMDFKVIGRFVANESFRVL